MVVIFPPARTETLLEPPAFKFKVDIVQVELEPVIIAVLVLEVPKFPKVVPQVPPFTVPPLLTVNEF